jgi:hypothetical protein
VDWWSGADVAMHWLITFTALFALATAGLMFGIAAGPELNGRESFGFPTNYKNFKKQVELVGNYALDHGWYVYTMLWATQVYWKMFGIPGIRTLVSYWNMSYNKQTIFGSIV